MSIHMSCLIDKEGVGRLMAEGRVDLWRGARRRMAEGRVDLWPRGGPTYGRGERRGSIRNK